jgi:putative membrane protein
MKAKSIIIKTTTLAGLVMLCGLPLRAAEPETSTTAPQRGQLSESDYRFAVKAARGGLEEVELGQLAKQKGSSDAVRNFGDHMVADHSKANEELTQIASRKGATLPPTLSHGERSTLDDLQKAGGADFDKTYAKDMVKDHKKDLREFESAAKDVTDPDIRSWAEKTIPTLQQHLQMAQDMEATVKGQK